MKSPRNDAIEVSELGYVVLGSARLDEWEHFSRYVLGMMPVRPGDDVLELRTDDRACRILIEAAGDEHLTAAGWMLADQHAYETAVEALGRIGLEATTGTPRECHSRKVSEFSWILDPMGHRHEIAWGPMVDYRRPFHSSAANAPFRGEHTGIGHLVLNCDPRVYPACQDFAQDVLGLGLSNFRRQRLEGGDASPMLSWFHCRKNHRHHSFAWATVRNPHACQHIMIQVAHIDDVGMCHDRCLEHGVTFASTFGRHVNDRVFSFYMVTPSGFWIEYGADAQPIDPGHVIAIDDGAKGSVWGHRFLIPLGET